MDRIGRYDIAAEIGRGGMGIVYRAHDPRMGRDVAVKLMREPGDDPDGSLVERFVREAHVAARISHPGVVAVLDAGLHGGHPFVAMDFIEGASLKATAGAGRLPPRRLAEIVRQVAEAVHHGHERGVIHRDLKPANIMITSDGRALVADFGLAYDVAAQESLTRTGQILGTPEFMSPEQASGESARGAGTDVWSLGAVLYWGLTGRAPFQGNGPFEIIKRLLLEEPPAPRSLDPTAPEELERIALRCLCKPIESRPASAKAVAIGLERFLEGRPLGDWACTTSSVRAEGSERARAAGSSRGPAVGLAAVAVVAMVGVAAVVLAGALGSESGSEAAGGPIDVGAEEGAELEREPPPTDPVPNPDPDPDPIPPEPDADEWLERARAAVRDDPPTAIEAADRAIELDEGNAVAWALRGRAKASAGDLDAAIADATRSIELDPSLAIGWGTRAIAGSGQSLDGLVVPLWKNSKRVDPGRLLPDLDAAIERGSDDPDVWLVRASVRNARGQRVAAAADATRAIELDGSYAAAWITRAESRLELRDLDGANADLDRAIELDAGIARAWAFRGIAARRAGDLEGALGALDRAVQLPPEDPSWLYQRGRTRWEAGDPEGAIADLDRSLAIQPYWAWTWVIRGLAKQDKGDLAGAFFDASRAVDLGRKIPWAWALRAEVRLARGDREGARSDLRRALDLPASRDPRVQVRIDRLRAALGED